MLDERLRLVAARLLRRAAKSLTQAADSWQGRDEPTATRVLRGGLGTNSVGIQIYNPSPAAGSLRQGEILTGVVQSVLTLESVGTEQPEIDFITHPFCVIATQDCDLEQDFKATGAGRPGSLPSILLYEVEEALTLIAKLPSSEAKKQTILNKIERYQVLQSVPQELDREGAGIVDLGIDFKRYFTIPRDELYKQLASVRRRCVLRSPYLEQFATRAAAFQSRVALPLDHDVKLPKK